MSIATEKEIKNLIQELKQASAAYYLGEGKISLTDEEFDAKQNYLNTIKENGEHPQLFAKGTDGEKILDGEPLLGAIVEELAPSETATHDYPMLSLAKAKEPKQLSTYLTKVREAGAKDFTLQAKLDGSAMSVKYINGKLAQIATRGDGETGENITYITDSDNLTVKGLPKETSLDGTIEIRGEIFFTNNQFEKTNNNRIEKTGESFQNPRNAVSGLLKRAKLGIEYEVEMTFGAYSLVKDGHMATINELDDNPDFTTIGNITDEQAHNIKVTGFKDDEEIHDSINKIGNIIDSFSIPVDGIVIKPSNEGEMYEKMGLTSHHPVSQIAWKYPSEQAESVVTNITITVGKAGKVTPIAEIEPVKVDGSTISRASLHNFNLVSEKDIRIGSKVIIEKANMIIPQIVAVISNPEWTAKVETPENCPSCNKKLESQGNVYPPRTLLCTNNKCESRDLSSLKSAVGRTYLDIEGLSEATLTALNEIGRVTNISDLYTLTLEELTNLDMTENTAGTKIKLGEKRATNILNHIEKSKTLPLDRILPSLSIPTLGRRAAKIIVKTFPTIEKLLQATTEDFENIEGFGKIKATNAYEGLQNKKEIIQKMKNFGVTFGETTNVDNETEKENQIELNGISFTISGSVPQPFPNRDALVSHIEANGGEFHSSPKTSTTYMIGENTGTSSKIKKAITLGTIFITPEEFTEKFVTSQ